MVYRAGAGMVEDIYELQPGADPSAIRYRVEGAERLELTKDGSLQIITPAGPFTVKPPVAFQEVEGKQRRIPCSFVISGLSYGFATEPYDSRLALVIDPQLVYGSFLGGSGSGDGSSQGYSIAVAGGKAYLAGTTDTALFPTTTGSYDPSFQGEQDLTITIINPQGNGAGRPGVLHLPRRQRQRMPGRLQQLQRPPGHCPRRLRQDLAYRLYHID